MYALSIEDYPYVTTDKSRFSYEDVKSLLSQTHWASSRSNEAVKNSIDNSLCFYLVDQEKLAGFARVITDFTTFAYICDVVVDEAHQGSGFGTFLMESILSDPAVKHVPQWRLKTTYAAEFYSRFGFHKVTDDITHMEYFPKI